MQDSVKQDRQKYIGGSDIPVIMNLSPFKRRYDLLLEKAGIKENDFNGNVFTEYGNTLEPVIRDYINHNHFIAIESPFIEGKHTRDALAGEVLGVRIHTDGENEKAILEIKTTGAVSDNLDDYKLYIVQLLYYMTLTDKKIGLLAVYERPGDFNTEFDARRLKIYTIRLEEYTALIEDIENAIQAFINDLAKVKENPFISEQELLPSELPDIAEKIIAFESQLSYMKKVEAEIKIEKERLRQAMRAGNIKGWVTPSGWRLTLVDDTEDKSTQKFNEAKFKTENPELYNKYLEAAIVKGKKGYVKITAPKEEA